jgi:hypothetical protein
VLLRAYTKSHGLFASMIWVFVSGSARDVDSGRAGRFPPTKRRISIYLYIHIRRKGRELGATHPVSRKNKRRASKRRKEGRQMGVLRVTRAVQRRLFWARASHAESGEGASHVRHHRWSFHPGKYPRPRG